MHATPGQVPACAGAKMQGHPLQTQGGQTATRPPYARPGVGRTLASANLVRSGRKQPQRVAAGRPAPFHPKKSDMPTRYPSACGEGSRQRIICPPAGGRAARLAERSEGSRSGVGEGVGLHPAHTGLAPSRATSRRRKDLWWSAALAAQSSPRILARATSREPVAGRVPLALPSPNGGMLTYTVSCPAAGTA